MSSGTLANRKAVRKYPATDRDAGRGRENKTEYLYEYGILGNITKNAEDGKTYGRVYYYDYDGKQRSVCEIDRINRKSVAYNCYDMLANRVVG